MTAFSPRSQWHSVNLKIKEQLVYLEVHVSCARGIFTPWKRITFYTKGGGGIFMAFNLEFTEIEIFIFHEEKTSLFTVCVQSLVILNLNKRQRIFREILKFSQKYYEKMPLDVPKIYQTRLV